jgi:hypothetical protein
MRISGRALWMAIIAFALLAGVANVGVVETWTRDLLGGGVPLRMLGAILGATFLALALFIWIGAIRHFRGNAALSGSRRRVWQAVVYFGFVFGAIVYALQFVKWRPDDAFVAHKGPETRVGRV